MSEPHSPASSARECVHAGLRVLASARAQPLQRLLDGSADALLGRLAAWPALVSTTPFGVLSAAAFMAPVPAPTATTRHFAAAPVSPDDESRTRVSAVVHADDAQPPARTRPTAATSPSGAPVASLRANARAAGSGMTPARSVDDAARPAGTASVAAGARVSLRAVSARKAGAASAGKRARVPGRGGPDGASRPGRAPGGTAANASGKTPGSASASACMVASLASEAPLAALAQATLPAPAAAARAPAHTLDDSLPLLARLARDCLERGARARARASEDGGTAPAHASDPTHMTRHAVARGQRRADDAAMSPRSAFGANAHLTPDLDAEEAGRFLAALLNAHLVEEARRHGVDLA